MERTKEELNQSIRAALGKASIEEALNQLLTYTEQFNPKKLEEANALRAVFLNAKGQYELRGVISKQEYDLVFARTVNGVQAILGEQTVTGLPFEVTTKRNQTAPFVLGLIGLACLILIGVLFWPQASIEPTVVGPEVNLKENDQPESEEGAVVNLTPKKEDPSITEVPSQKPTNGAAGQSSVNPKETPESTNHTQSEKAFFTVRVVVNAGCSDGIVYVDGQPAEMVNSTPTIKTIRVVHKNEAHLFEIKGANHPPVRRLIIDNRQKIIIPCN